MPRIAGSNPVFLDPKSLASMAKAFFFFFDVFRCDPLILNFGSQMGCGKNLKGTVSINKDKNTLTLKVSHNYTNQVFSSVKKAAAYNSIT